MKKSDRFGNKMCIFRERKLFQTFRSVSLIMSGRFYSGTPVSPLPGTLSLSLLGESPLIYIFKTFASLINMIREG